MKQFKRSLSMRLALAFALISMLSLGIIGVYLYRSLQQEIAWRDDQALLGRLERMQLLLKNTPDIHEHWLMVHKGNRVRACADPFL